MFIKIAQKFARQCTRHYKRHQVRTVLTGMPMKTKDDLGITQLEIDKMIDDMQ